MRKLTAALLAGMCLSAAAPSFGQPPPRGNRSLVDANTLVARMMKLDADQNGQLSQGELKDERLRPLFAAADANHDGVLTRAELAAYFTDQLAAAEGARRNRRPPGPPPGEGFPGGPGGPRLRPPDGPPGPPPRD